MDSSINKRANFIRYNFIENIDNFILTFENKITGNGIDVKWISDEEDLVSYIKSVLPKLHYNKVCFDLTHIPDELNDRSDNLIKKVSVSKVENNDESADFLITKANFGLADTGSVVILDHNSRNCFNKVDNLILILDLNNIISKSSDLGIILSLYEPGGTVDTSVIDIITSPFDKIIRDSFQYNQQESYQTQKVSITLLLYDNGITDLLSNEKLRDSLYCINCGRCRKVCPLFSCGCGQTPIEMVKHNWLQKSYKSNDIYKTTLLCGNCEHVCPVLIPFNKMFIHELELATNIRHDESLHDLAKNFTKRAKINKYNGKLRRYFLINKLYKNNRKLYNYYMDQKDDFYNLTRNNEEDNA